MNKSTFRQDLTLEAEFNASNVDVSGHINRIKNEMKKYVNRRIYTVSLVDAHDTMAIGSIVSNIREIFVPEYITPEDYRKCFIKEFKKLGFTDEFIELSEKRTDLCDYYDIKLLW